jgi:predicted nucleic acid-binding Zn ribbon protein
MKRTNTEPIGNVIRRILREEGLESPLNERRLIDSWTEVLGNPIASYTRDLYIRNQTLYVKVSSSVLRQELLMGKDLLIRNLNKHVGADVIHNIVFI